MTLAEFLTRYPFVLPSFAAGLIVALLCSVLSVYVVLRKMAFIGQGIGHAAFGGVALGLWLVPASAGPLDWRVYLIAVGFCLLNAAAIGLITRRTDLSEDTAIGILFVVSMSLGAILFHRSTGQVSDLFSYLFGSVVAVTWSDVATMAGLGCVVLGTVTLLSKELQYLCFDEPSALAAGLPVGWLHHLLLALLSLTVVLAVKVVGIILVSAALVLPGATGRLVCRSFGGMMLASAGFGVVATMAGLLVANLVDVPAGAAVVLVQSAVFVGVWLAAGRR
ncbi:MAG: metal ABC transporter permease [Candidatus Sumerlaeia bacterium]|nr:metal ABC transporter permease [Candidatus Sumerlaeia bacterium]